MFAALLLGSGAAVDADKCLTGPSASVGATGTGDDAELRSALAALDAACDCDAFDGSSKTTRRGAYKKCARDVARGLEDAGQLRRQCGRTLRRSANKSTCGRVAGQSGPWLPCVELHQTTGRVRCKIKPETKLIT